jgi:hypothetical protein
VARELARLPDIGDGAVHRVVMQVERQYFDAPDPLRPARAALVEPPPQ